jgi:Uma2 family endonuclease
MATHPQTLITAEEFYQLPQEEGREFELRGEAIHETDFSDRQLTTLLPDLVILFNEKLAALDLDELPVTVPPDMVIEVISASESYSQVNRRINAYRHFGVREVWIFDYQNLQMNLHGAAGAKRLCSGDALESPLLPGWSVAVDEIF